MTAKADSMDKLLTRINSRRLSPKDKEQFIKSGRFAYEYLIEKLDSPQLTDYQVIHALEILMGMRYIGEPSEAIAKILALTQDERIRVRSAAANMAISLLRQSEHCGTPSHQLNRQKLQDTIARALAIGLDASSTSYALDFISGEI